MIRNAVSERRPDVLDAEPVDEQLRELDHPVDHGHGRAEQIRVELAHRADARRRRRDDQLLFCEDPGEATREARSLVAVAAVQVHLAAARLVGRERDLVPESLEHLDAGARGLGEESVSDAGDEERDPHAVACFQAFSLSAET